MSSIPSPVYQASGIASGIDTTALVNSLLQIESKPITVAQTQQAAYQSQISQLGNLVSQLTAFGAAADALKTSGALGLTTASSYLGFDATPQAGALAGRTSIQVTQLADAAKGRSQAFASSAAPVTGGTLTLGVAGTNYNVTIGDGDSLQTVAASINAAGAPVSAAVLTSNGSAYLSLTTTATGYSGTDPNAALSITESSTGTQGQALNATVFQQAANAKFTVDKLQFETSSNTVTDAVPGVTLQLKALTSTPETMVLQNDTTSTQANLQKFVTAYNAVANIINGNLNISQNTDRTQTLGGDASLRSLQASMQALITNRSNPGTSVSSLADLGITTQSDGTLAIDSTKLASALQNDAKAVNSIFQNANTGVTAAVDALTTQYTDATTGIFTSKQAGLQKSVSDLSSHIESLQLRVDGYKQQLIAEFTAMEKTVSNFKSIGSYLTQQSAVSTKSA
jgi:flagellar hook-associated protein 2